MRAAIAVPLEAAAALEQPDQDFLPRKAVATVAAIAIVLAAPALPVQLPAPPEAVAALVAPAWELRSHLSVGSMAAIAAPPEAVVVRAGAANFPPGVAGQTWQSA